MFVMEVAGRAALITVCNKRSRERTARNQCCQPRLRPSCKLITGVGSRPQRRARESAEATQTAGEGNRATQSKVLAPITQTLNDAFTPEDTVDNGRS